MKPFSHPLKKLYRYKILPRLRKELGIDALQDDLLALMNNAVDITQCKPATGTLRKIQLGDLELLRLFDILCEKNGLTYWLDWGTLLGAVRHRGFIPWDDDLDVCMPREDFNKMIPILTDYFSGKEGFCVATGENAEKKWLWVNYWQASVLIDVFPIDSIPVTENETDSSIQERVLKIWQTPVVSEETVCRETDPRAYFYTKSIGSYPRFYRTEMLFPLRRIPFETYELCVPNDCHSVLTLKYGNYMSFPRNGVAHHKGIVENQNFSEEMLDQVTEQLRQMQKDLLEQP